MIVLCGQQACHGPEAVERGACALPRLYRGRGRVEEGAGPRREGAGPRPDGARGIVVRR